MSLDREAEVLPPAEKAKRDRDLKTVTTIKDKNEKLSWTRRQKRLEDLIAEKLNPLSDRIRVLTAEYNELIDDITATRKVMVKECIHPKGSLSHHGTYITCKFCNSRLSIPKSPSL